MALLDIPDYVRQGPASRREETIHAHGFRADQVPIAWFNRELEKAGFEPTVSVEPNDEGEEPRPLTRGGLFRLAEPVAGGFASDAQVLTFLWNVLAWGSGPSPRNNRTRIASFRAPADRTRRVASLRESFAAAIEGEVRHAYANLLSPSPHAVPGLGPSFFSKALYFVGAGDISHRAVILDNRVASALHAAGWGALRRRAPWSPDVYAEYCDLAAQWSFELSEATGRRVGGDEIEIALWRNAGLTIP